MLELKPEFFDLADSRSHPLAVCGRPMRADNTGALYWPGQRTLVLADLSLADDAPTGDSHTAPARPGVRATLTRLADAMDRYEPARIVVLGVKCGAPATLAADSLEILRILQEDCEWIWVTAEPSPIVPPQLGGSVRSALDISGLVLRHRPSPGGATHEIAGHLRPAAHLSMYGYSFRRACFVGNGRRLVMPAFAAPASGLNVLDRAFQPLFGSGGMSVWMLGEEGLYPIASRLLVGDA